jgi:Magnesium chelatase, subunit ChlI
MLARRLTTILPAMTLAEALETTRIHRVAGLTGDRTALVTTRPFRAPHHTISDVGLIGGGQVPMPGEVCWPTTACSFWTSCPNSAATSWRSCGNRSMRVPRAYNLQRVLTLSDAADFANRLLTASCSSRVH